jgi:hypothetical protein
MSLINDLERFTVINNFFYGIQEDAEGEFILFEEAKNLYNTKCRELATVREQLTNETKRANTETSNKNALQNTLTRERKEFERILASKELVIKLLTTFCAFVTVILIGQIAIELIEVLL